MLATQNDVLELTGKSVNASLISRAQSIVEIYVGRLESEVSLEKDLEYLKRAVAYQSVYMQDNEDLVFEQIAASTISQNDAATTFKSGDDVSPWIAPLVVLTCKRLSFMKSRTVKTGMIWNRPFVLDWRRD